MSFSSLLALALTAILAENFVLVKFLGVGPFLRAGQKIETAPGMGLTVTFVMTVASAFCYGIDRLLRAVELPELRTLAFILVIVVLVQLVEMFLRRVMPKLHGSLGRYLPLLAVNCSVLGVAVINAGEARSFIAAVVYGTGAGLGFLVAIVLFSSIQERLEFSDCPKSFEGFPIALTTAALLSLAFMGFSGLHI